MNLNEEICNLFEGESSPFSKSRNNKSPTFKQTRSITSFQRDKIIEPINKEA